MGKKFGENQKQQQGRENKQKTLELKKKHSLEEKGKKEEESWKQGAKDMSKQEAERLKMEEKKAKKKERESLLLQEEASDLPNTKFRTSPKTIMVSPTSPASAKKDISQNGAVYSASNVDDALELLTTITSSSSTIASSVERHPERRMKAAFAAFEERELPILKNEYPSLRLSQLQEILRKKFAKSDENPMNQPHVSYEATPDEIRKLASKIQESKLDSFKSNH